MNVKIQKLNEDDINKFIQLLTLFEQVFEMKNFQQPEKKHLQHILTKSNFIAMVATEDDVVVGGLTAYILDQYYVTKPLAYIYDLAVLEEKQRLGIGKKLINAMIIYGKSIGCEEVFVQADRVEQHAVSFYRSTPITAEEDVIHFYYSLEK